MLCSHMGENTQPEAEGWESPAARLRKAWMGLQDMLKGSVPTAINPEIHEWEQTEGDMKSPVSWSPARMEETRNIPLVCQCVAL